MKLKALLFVKFVAVLVALPFMIEAGGNFGLRQAIASTAPVGNVEADAEIAKFVPDKNVVLAEIYKSDVKYFGTPVRVEIPSVGIDLDVTNGTFDYNTGEWTVDNGRAYFANLSDAPNTEDSNTVVYAHNQVSEFYNTKDLKAGDKIFIYTDTGDKLTYSFVSDQLVDPSNGNEIIRDVDESTLTLLTCNGRFDETRRLMFATLDK